MLEIIEKYRNDFKIIGLSAHSNKKLLLKQAKKFKVSNIVLAAKDGEKNVSKLASLKQADIVVNVISGIAGIKPSLAALKVKKILILGNKESIVAEYKKILKLISRSYVKASQSPTQILGSASNGPSIIPLDSEHNAIYEIIEKVYTNNIKKNLPHPKITRIFLPCSGGPFLGKTRKELEKISIKEALNHPKWKMGSKISIESATLINKGLEIIEAHHLFRISLNKIEVFLHPECQIHSIVEFEYGNHTSKFAYYGKPDMREHIENALLRSIDRVPNRTILSLSKVHKKFQKPDHKTFPGIKIIISIYKKHPTKMKKFLKKEEETIEKFLSGEIKFNQIFDLH